MSDSLESFLASRLPIVGLVGYSIQVTDRVLTSECCSKSLYPTTVAQLLDGTVHGVRTLLPPGEKPAQYCWTFEYFRVYVAARSDGACLALLVENNPGAQIVRIQEALQAFIDLA